jgi:hypothetical protein
VKGLGFRNHELRAGAGTCSGGTVAAVGMKWCVMAMAVIFTVVTPTGSCQFQRIPQPQLPGGPPEVINPREDTSRMAEQMRQARNAMRQKKLVAQTALLQKLAVELNADMGRTDGSVLPADISRKSEQIEKLAKSIRELMIGPL